MKKWLAVLYFSPLGLLAQDCKLKTTTDPFTHVNKLTTGFQPFDSSGVRLSISADATPTEIDFFIWVKGDGNCFDAESTALLQFEGERLKATFRNSGSMNCDGAFHFSFKNTPTTHSWLNRLATKKVASIKLTGNNKTEVQVNFSEEQRARFQNMAACIAAESKSLLKK